MRRDDDALFAHNAGPQSWKQVLFPPTLRLWKASRNGDGAVEIEQNEAPPNYAFIGVRSCDLHAIAIQDRVFMGDQYVDHDYEARRRDAFIVAVNCAKAGGTCFCVSMGTGPKAESGFDLALTELLDGGHRFLVEVGSERGAEVLAELAHRPAAEDDDARGRRGRSRRRRPRWAARSTPTASRSCCTRTPSTRAGTTWPSAA